MSDAARDAKTLASAYKTAAHSLSIGLDAASRLLDSLLKNKDTQEFAELFYKISKDPNHNEKDFMVAREVHPEIVPELSNILKREAGLAAKIISANSKDENTTNVVTYFDCQTKQMTLAMSEALAKSGLLPEISRQISDEFADKLKENPMLEVKDLSIEKYELLRQDISQLGYPLNRITLFPKYHSDETKVDVGFLSQISKRSIKGVDGKMKEEGPYSTLDVVKGLLMKQQLLENSKEGSAAYETFVGQQREYAQVIKETAFRFDEMKADAGQLSNIFERIRRLDIPVNDKKALLDLVNKSRTSKAAREDFVKKLDSLEVDQSIKNLAINKIKGLHDVQYLMPVTIAMENDEPAYSLEKNYITIGAGVTSHSGDKETVHHSEKAEEEIDFFLKSNLNVDRTVLILNEEEFLKYKNKKDLKKEVFGFLRNGDEKIHLESLKIKEQDGVSNKMLKVIDDNRSYLEVLDERTEGIDFEPSLLKELIKDNLDALLGGTESLEWAENAINDVEQEFVFSKITGTKTLDGMIKDVEQEPIHSDREREYPSFANPMVDDYYDRNHDGIDDRNQV